MWKLLDMLTVSESSDASIILSIVLIIEYEYELRDFDTSDLVRSQRLLSYDNSADLPGEHLQPQTGQTIWFFR